MAYGSDATGGVINIITKKGEYASTTLDAAVGSWGAQKYAVTNSVKKISLIGLYLILKINAMI